MCFVVGSANTVFTFQTVSSDNTTIFTNDNMSSNATTPSLADLRNNEVSDLVQENIIFAENLRDYI